MTKYSTKWRHIRFNVVTLRMLTLSLLQITEAHDSGHHIPNSRAWIMANILQTSLFAIIWISDEPVYWRTYVSPGLNEFRLETRGLTVRQVMTFLCALGLTQLRLTCYHHHIFIRQDWAVPHNRFIYACTDSLMIYIIQPDFYYPRTSLYAPVMDNIIVSYAKWISYPARYNVIVFGIAYMTQVEKD